MKKTILLSTILTISLMLLNLAVIAGPPGGGGGGAPGCALPPCVPIDGGLSILMAAGAALGGKKLYDQFKR